MRPGTPEGSGYISPEFRRIRNLLRDAQARIKYLEREGARTPSDHEFRAWLQGVGCGLALSVAGGIAWLLASFS